MARSEETRRVQDALAKLDDKLDRDIVRLRVFEGLTLRETASRLGITVDQVRGRFQSALRQLERELGEPE
jgi:RNA polymerase sigma factor (sigma-70 family)